MDHVENKLLKLASVWEVDMLPKIKAAIEFLESNHDGSVLITSLASVSDALKGKAGTFITFE